MNEPILAPPDITIDFQKSWRTFLLEWKMAASYHIPYQLQNAPKIPYSMLDQLLTSLLFLRAISILDEGLTLYIQIKNISMPRRKYRKSLEGRISVLSDEGILDNSKDIHDLRIRRNEVAHESHSHTTWEQLAQDLSVIESSFQKLDLVSDRPHLEAYGERSEINWVDDDPEIAGERTFRCGVKENGITAIEFTWNVKILK